MQVPSSIPIFELHVRLHGYVDHLEVVVGVGTIEHSTLHNQHHDIDGAGTRSGGWRELVHGVIGGAGGVHRDCDHLCALDVAAAYFGGDISESPNPLYLIILMRQYSRGGN